MPISSFFKKPKDLTKLNPYPTIKNNLSDKLKISLLKDSPAELMALEGALKNAINPSSVPRNCALYLKIFDQTLKKHKSSFTNNDKQTIAILCISVISRVSSFLDANNDIDLSSGNANSGIIGVALMLSFNKNKTLANYPSTYVKNISSKAGKPSIKQAWNNLIDKYNTRVTAFEKAFPNYNPTHPQQLITQGNKV